MFRLWEFGDTHQHHMKGEVDVKDVDDDEVFYRTHYESYKKNIVLTIESLLKTMIEGGFNVECSIATFKMFLKSIVFFFQNY